MRKIGSILIITICLSIFYGCSIEINENAKHVEMYEIKAVDNYSDNKIKKIRWFIDAPEAKSEKQRVYTALEAAQNCKKETSAKECTIYQVATSNAFMYGDMFYTVLVLDKNDKTKAEVTSKLLSKQENNIGFYYTKLRTAYKNATPEEFKKAFFTVMIEKLKIPKNELKLPVMQREEFKID